MSKTKKMPIPSGLKNKTPKDDFGVLSILNLN
jgi:hypothetical protein